MKKNTKSKPCYVYADGTEVPDNLNVHSSEDGYGTIIESGITVNVFTKKLAKSIYFKNEKGLFINIDYSLTITRVSNKCFINDNQLLKEIIPTYLGFSMFNSITVFHIYKHKQKTKAQIPHQFKFTIYSKNEQIDEASVNKGNKHSSASSYPWNWFNTEQPGDNYYNNGRGGKLYDSVCGSTQSSANYPVKYSK